MKQDIFRPQETRENPYDVILVVEDGREFKAHRKVLSEASAFFEKLLSSGMMESTEGVAGLEMPTEAGLGAVLEFIYTSRVQMLDEDKARDLIEMADYLFIPQLKTFAERYLAQKLNLSNCISTYHFAESYQCEKLTSDAKELIHANFINVAKAEEFRNLSSEEVIKWISSDEIVVGVEEDVFKIILSWIDHDRSEREKYFADLFGQVRLVYVSRDYLFNHIVTNDLVNDNACCLTLVKGAVKALESKNPENMSVPHPRKSLETPVIVVSTLKEDRKEDEPSGLLYYVPRTNTWHRLRDTSRPPVRQIISCHGMLYTFFPSTTQHKCDYKLLCYDSFFDRWMDVPHKGKRDLRKIFVSDNEDGIYALESEHEKSCPDCVALHSCNGSERVTEFFPCGKQHLSYIMKYRPESNSWEDISSFDLGLRYGICIVAKGNFIYFIGGYINVQERDKQADDVLTDVDRYDLSRRKWDKLAHIQEARIGASGTAPHRNIFITGGFTFVDDFSPDSSFVKTCEVYNETRNEWQLIARSRRSPYSSIMCVDDKVYVVDNLTFCHHSGRESGEIECYDPDKDEWYVITKIPLFGRSGESFGVRTCSMKVFMGGGVE